MAALRACAVAIVVAAAVAAAGAIGCGLLEPDEFVCTRDNECPGQGGYGRCIQSHCAFRSDSCASGWLWDETGGPVADQCVPDGALAPDAGASDAGPSDAGPDGGADAAPADAGPDGGAADARAI